MSNRLGSYEKGPRSRDWGGDARRHGAVTAIQVLSIGHGGCCSTTMDVTRNAQFEFRSAGQIAVTEELGNASPEREEVPRSWLRCAARALPGAQTAVPGETPWIHVASGCWTPIDSFEYGAKLYVIAQRNSPDAQKRNSLTKREQAVLAAIAQGVSRKCIGYDQNISQPTVSLILARLRDRLNAPTAAELARVLWVLRPEEGSQPTTGVSYWTIARQEYATFSRAPAGAVSIEELTRSERMVFQAVIAGFSTEAIAAMRGSSQRTLANQLSSIFRKLGVGSRGEMLAHYAHCYREVSADLPRDVSISSWRPQVLRKRERNN